LEQVIKRYLDEEVASKRKPSTLTLYEHYLVNLIAPQLGSKKIAAITRSDIATLHLDIGAEMQVSANRAMAALSGLFTFAGRHNLVPDGFNPVRGLQKFREYGRERYLSAEEALAEMFRLCRDGKLRNEDIELACVALDIPNRLKRAAAAAA
jgi:integrase